MNDVSNPLPASAPGAAGRLLTEPMIGPAAAGRLFPVFRDGKPTHPSTVTRWMRDGVRLPDGTVVRLESVRIGNRLATSREAVRRFIEAQQTVPAAAPAVRTPADRRRASEAAGRELERLGCC